MSDSPYIRLSVMEMQALDLVHLVSGMDEDVPDHPGAAAVATTITGYTEWINDSKAVTIGWDWQMPAVDRRRPLLRVGTPSSNVMLQNADRHDLGPRQSAALLALFIDGIDWQSATLLCLNTRYHS